MTVTPTYNDPPPEQLLDYFRRTHHSGRGNGHLNAITDCIVPALAAHPLLAPIAEAGELSYMAGARQGMRGIDIALGVPPSGAVFDSVVGMYAGMPEKVQILGRYTSIMTEHAKAQRNRAEDFMRFADKTARTYGSDTVRFGVCPVNASTTYYSYTARGVNNHSNGQAKAARAIDILRGEIPIRTEPNKQGLDALWLPVVVTDNGVDDADRHVEWLRNYPQPADGQPFSLGWFVDTVARAYVERFTS